MNDRERYEPGPATGATVEKDGEQWTLVLVRELRHSPALVWQALTDPAHLREWAPFEGQGAGTRLTLWHNINRNFIAMGAAGWHVCFDVLERHLSGHPIGRIVGADALKFPGWQRLHKEYAKQFMVETPNVSPQGRVQ